MDNYESTNINNYPDTGSSMPSRLDDMPMAGQKHGRVSGWTFRRKLLAAGIVIVAVIVLVGVVGAIFIAQSLSQVAQDALVEFLALNRIESSTLEVLGETREYLLFGEEETLTELEESSTELKEALAEYGSTERISSQQAVEASELYIRIQTLSSELLKRSAETVALYESGADETELAEAAERLETVENTLALVVEDTRTIVANEVSETVVVTQTILRRTQILLIGVPLVMAVVSLGIFYILGRSLAQRLESLSTTAHRIATEGDLTQVAQVEGTDEIGVLAADFNLMTNRLRETLEGVEKQSHQFEAMVNIGRQILGILDLNTLMEQVVTITKETFNYYHVHIYLLDETSQELKMAEGYGPAGAKMKLQGHKIALDAPTSLVARAARSSQIVSVANVRNTPDWLDNPFLPDTCSEMAVPIVLEDSVVGVLDVQQDRVAGLDEGDANVLRSLANQVAVGIRNVRLFKEVEIALAEAQAAQERYLEEAWEKSKIVTEGQSYLYAQPDAASPDDKKQQALIRAQQQAVNQNRLAVVSDNDVEGVSVVAPVILRDKTIGLLQLHTSNKNQAWTEDDFTIMEAVAEQFAQTAENLRLFDQTRSRAGREATIREITDKLRTANNLNELMEIAIEEMGERFSATYAELNVDLNPAASPGNGNKAFDEFAPNHKNLR